MSAEKHVVIEKKNAVAVITIDRPDKRNALDRATHNELLAALAAMEHDRDVRVVILTGNGKAFISGWDVAEFAGKTPVDMVRLLFNEPSVLDAADRFPKPLIAMTNGWCLGSGNELAMACDIRIASEDAKFGQPEVNL